MNDDSSPATFAEWVTQGRRQARFSIRELAADAGVSHSYISKLEAVPVAAEQMKPRPSRQVVRDIARVLGLDPDAGLRLAGWLPDPSDPPEIERISDPDRQWVARYRRLSPDRQALIDALIEQLGVQNDK